MRLWQIDSPTEWPQVVILDLTPEQFMQFEKEAVAYAVEHGLYPRQPVNRILGSVKLAAEEGFPTAPESASGWTVAIYHGKTSRAFYVACAQGDC